MGDIFFKKLLFSISGVSADRGMWWATEKILVWTTETTNIQLFWPTKNSNFVWFIAIYLNQNNDAWTESWGGERKLLDEGVFISQDWTRGDKNQWSKRRQCYIKKQGIWLRRDWLERSKENCEEYSQCKDQPLPNPTVCKEGLLCLSTPGLSQKWQSSCCAKSLGCRGKLFPGGVSVKGSC